MEFLQAIKQRRSIYDINRDILVEEKQILELIETAVKYTPSAYNSESQRLAVLLGEKHDRLWEMVKEEIKKRVKPEDFAVSEKKINAFKNGYGTVLFFDDRVTTNALMEKFALYKDNFAKWAIEQNGMLQSNVWVGLESLGLGASLQHYNELIESRVKEEFGIDENWQLNAQMPFGNLVSTPDEKPKKDLAERMKILK
jgi:predicted oxidoreductase (fatty acid repression mutant protein)